MAHTLKNLVRGLTLVMILVLTVLSIYGAFINVEGAGAFFRSPVMAVFWAVLLGLTLVSLIAFRRMLRNPGLLAMHLGFALILVGSMRNSERGHEWATRFRSSQTWASRFVSAQPFRRGYMALVDGDTTSTVFDTSMRTVIGRFPLDVHLQRFTVDYYETNPADCTLYLGWVRGDAPEDVDPWQVDELSWRVGQVFDLPETPLKLHIRDVRKSPMGEGRSLYDLEVALVHARQPRVVLLQALDDHTPMRVEVGAVWPEIDDLPEFMSLMLVPPGRSVQRYQSLVTFLRAGEEVGEAAIIVNRPARTAGYQVYQYSWGQLQDPGGELYTVLMVVSYAGMTLVYLGFALVTAGTFIYCWFPPRRRRTVSGERTP